MILAYRSKPCRNECNRLESVTVVDESNTSDRCEAKQGEMSTNSEQNIQLPHSEVPQPSLIPVIGVESSEATVLHYWRCVVSCKAVRFVDLKGSNEQRDPKVVNPLTWTFTVHRCRCRRCPSLSEVKETLRVSSRTRSIYLFFVFVLLFE